MNSRTNGYVAFHEQIEAEHKVINYGLLAQEIFGINLKRAEKIPTQQIKVHCANNIKPAKLCTDKVV